MPRPFIRPGRRSIAVITRHRGFKVKEVAGVETFLCPDRAA